LQEHGYKSITPVELKERLNRGENMVLLDVREPWEFTLAHSRPEGQGRVAHRACTHKKTVAIRPRRRLPARLIRMILVVMIHRAKSM
jgi:rhodanese-related sulfurtransferase